MLWEHAHIDVSLSEAAMQCVAVPVQGSRLYIACINSGQTSQMAAAMKRDPTELLFLVCSHRGVICGPPELVVAVAGVDDVPFLADVGLGEAKVHDAPPAATRRVGLYRAHEVGRLHVSVQPSRAVDVLEQLQRLVSCRQSMASLTRRACQSWPKHLLPCWQFHLASVSTI